MLVVDAPQSNEPRLNLAIEEYLLRHVLDRDPILFCYVNAPAVIVGRNQNVFEEIDLRFLRRQRIPIVRRLSGGGTVYHDLGNLNYCLLAPNQDLLNRYDVFTRPVTEALRWLGLSATLRQRSSIFVGDCKVSGNAQYATQGKLLSHGTLLVASDLMHLRQAVKRRPGVIVSNAVQSIRSPVANLSDLMGAPVPVAKIKDLLVRSFGGHESLTRVTLGAEDWPRVHQIVSARYSDWSWNIGRSPPFALSRQWPLPTGALTTKILVEKGIVQQVLLVRQKQEDEVAQTRELTCLRAVPYDLERLEAALAACGDAELPAELEPKQLLELLY